MHDHMRPQAPAQSSANDEPIIELTDIVGQSPQISAPQGHDDAVFETLKAPQAINRAYLAPPYPDLLDTVQPYGQSDSNQASSASTDAPIINLEQSEVIHTLTDIAPQESPLTLTHEENIKEAESQPESEEVKQSASPCLAAAPHDDDLDGQILRDICTLKSTLAAMQLRLAAQEACIASLEAKLMTMDMYEPRTMPPSVEPAQQQELEKIAAAAAARIVREEIQDLLIAIQKE